MIMSSTTHIRINIETNLLQRNGVLAPNLESCRKMKIYCSDIFSSLRHFSMKKDNKYCVHRYQAIHLSLNLEEICRIAREFIQERHGNKNILEILRKWIIREPPVSPSDGLEQHVGNEKHVINPKSILVKQTSKQARIIQLWKKDSV